VAGGPAAARLDDVDWHYLDHAAGSPARPEVVAAMLPLLTEGFGNPSGSHALARQARAELDGARARLAAVVGCHPGEVVLTSGGTEADDLAIRGVLDERGGEALCSAVEHSAVLQPVARAGGRTLPVDGRGLVDLDALAAALHPGVSLVSVLLVGNEVGTVQPLDAIAAVVRERAPGALVHTDASQALSWLDLREHTAAADLVTLASHKCGGPKGVGALVVRDGARVQAQLVGGGQERDRRSGTQHVAGAAGFAVAAERADAERAALWPRAAAWRASLVAAVLGGVEGAIDSAVPAGAGTDHLVPGIVHLCVPEVDSEALLFLLEHDHRVLAAAGSSCASGAQDPSHVLAALGIDRATARGAVRLSLGWSTTDDDVAAAISGLPEAATRLRAHARDGMPA
jgi:cysteine desulfurase